ALEARELVLAAEVIADVAVVDLAMPLVSGVFDADEDGDGCASTAAEDVACFLSAKLTGGARVPTQVVHVQPRELLGESEPDAVRGVALDPPAVGDEGDDARLPDAVSGPP